MKVGIKKIHENEWLINIGFVSIKMDHFSVELLNITLEHLIALESGKKHSVLKSYITLGLRLNELDDFGVQKLIREIKNEDLLILMQVSKSPQLEEKALRNVGIMLAKQLQEDIKTTPLPDAASVKEAIRRIVIKMFELEKSGDIEFTAKEAVYI